MTEMTDAAAEPLVEDPPSPAPADPRDLPPARHLVDVAQGGDEARAPHFSYRSVTIVNHGTETLWASAVAGQAIGARDGSARAAAVRVPPGHVVTAPIAGREVYLASSGASGSVQVPVYRWHAPQPYRSQDLGVVAPSVAVGSQPPLVDTTDAVTAYAALGQLHDGLTRLEVKRAFANVAAGATDSAIVAAVAAKQLVVVQAIAVAGATATSLTFKSKPAGAGSAISPLFANAANGGEILPFSPAGWLATVAGEGLAVDTGAGAATGILVGYVEL